MKEQQPGIDQWLPAARAGSQSALGQMLEASRRYLLWIARRELDPELEPKAGASDLVQDTLLEAQRDFGTFHGKSEAELLAWLRRLLLNNLANFARRYRDTAKRCVDCERSLDTLGPNREGDGGLVAPTPSPSEQAESKEQQEIVARAIQRLPADYQRVLALWQQEERTFEEIGTLMDRSPNAARMLSVRAIEHLQTELETI
jgi:RNA polymerase sigma-70 factor (ECF subfamily)